MEKYENAKVVLERYKHVPVRPPAGNTYFCYAPDLCHACHAKREEKRQCLRKSMVSAENYKYTPYDPDGQSYARHRRDYLNAMSPSWDAGPAPANCVKRQMQKALRDEWIAKEIALEKASIAMGCDKHYLSRLQIINMQAAQNGGEQNAVGDPLPYWDYDPHAPVRGLGAHKPYGPPKMDLAEEARYLRARAAAAFGYKGGYMPGGFCY